MTQQGNYFYNCHISPTEVMTIGKAKVYAGRWHDMEKDLDWDLRIRMNDALGLRIDGGRPLISADAKAVAILGDHLTTIQYPPTMDIDWEDFSTPPLETWWWEELVERIENIDHETAICVYCLGGHGRTGTVLSILAALSKQPLEKHVDVVSWVREKYCPDAVESWMQIDYIQNITGQYIDSKPSASFRNVKGQGNTTYEVEWTKPSIVKEVKSAISPETTMFSGKHAMAKEVVTALAKHKKGHKR